MPLWLLIPFFAVSVAVTLAAAALFADRLDHIGPRVGLPESLTGLVTALAADGPEISTALIALAQGEKRVSIGIVLGSNVFNIASMIGVSAIWVGAVRLRRQALMIEGAVASVATLLGAGAITGVLSPGIAAAGLAGVLVPYLLLIGRTATDVARPARSRHPVGSDDGELWRPVALAALAVALIVLGSVGMVDSAVAIAERWQVPAAVVGSLALAVLTSLPNAYTGIRLGINHRGTALVSETLNSNTINVAVGIVLPALFLSLSGVSGLVGFDVAWLILMTSAAILLLARPRGAGRLGGVAIVVLYLVFVIVHLA